MKFLFWVCLLLYAASFTEALKCMTCFGSSFEDCDVRGHVAECQENQKSCETTTRRHDGKLTVEKRCKDENACRDNQMQNDRRSGKSTQCNMEQANFFCTCCCNTELCNGGVPSCYGAAMSLPPPTVNECPAQKQVFPHGKVNCYGGEDQNQICRYQCTSPDYSIYPKGRDTNVCTRNSTWSIERPCCARPCPPYLLVDSMVLFHYKSEAIGRLLATEWIASVTRYAVFAWDALQQAALYFSGQPKLDTLINFADSNYDVEKLIELAGERMNPVNDGSVNWGAAIRYAANNMFTKEAGARDSRVPKMIQISTDRKPDDPVDAVAAAQEARERGILVYVLAFGADEANFDVEVLSAIVGENKNHLYIFNDQHANLTPAHFDDLEKHLCFNPCDHVLHDHVV